jgi:hypothetical protein
VGYHMESVHPAYQGCSRTADRDHDAHLLPGALEPRSQETLEQEESHAYMTLKV